MTDGRSPTERPGRVLRSGADTDTVSLAIDQAEAAPSMTSVVPLTVAASSEAR